MNKPPVTLKDLAINGNDLVSCGLVGPDIGKMLHRLLDIVLEHPEMNTKLQLLDQVNKILDEFDL